MAALARLRLFRVPPFVTTLRSKTRECSVDEPGKDRLRLLTSLLTSGAAWAANRIGYAFQVFVKMG